MVEYTGRGDPLRSIALLWRTGVKAGRSGLHLGAIVDAAIALADEAGIEQLSMRRLAERLGVGAMSLYAYVPGKAELIDLMVDRVNADLYREPPPELDTGDWRRAVTAVARRNWDQLARHPWLLAVDTSRPPLGPGTTAKYDLELRPLVGIGLDDVEVDLVLTLVLEHVRAAARLGLGQVATATATGSTDAQWWSVAGPALATLIEPERFPYAARIGEAAGREYDAAADPQRAFEFGLETILDGVADRIRRREAIVDREAGDAG